MFKKILCLFLGALLLTSCGEKKEDPKYVPQVNPNPQYFMTVEGKVDSALANKVSIKFVGLYVTSNPVCDQTFNQLEGASGWRQKEVIFSSPVSSSGNYSVKIPIDYYQAGYCNWQMIRMEDYSGLASNQNAGFTVAAFYPCGNSISCTMLPAENKLLKAFNMTAIQNNDCFKGKNSFQCRFSARGSKKFSGNFNVPRNGNYKFIENFNYLNGVVNAQGN